MNTPKLPIPLVSADWISDQLEHPDLIILDASLPKPKSTPEDNPLSDLQIPGARFFDIDHVFSDTSSDLPHTMLTEMAFTQETQNLGINKNSMVVAYDNFGVYSSPRAWWMLRSMGHENVAVLDGGLPQWVEAGHPTETKQSSQVKKGDFIARYQSDFFRNSKDVFDSIDDANTLVLDARSNGRFDGTEPEPRAGLRGGHIPNSINMYFEDVTKDHKMRPVDELKEQFEKRGIQNEQLVFSCGSGLTACIIALAADLVGYRNTSVYDGSWSEWGQPGNLPIA